MRQRNTSVWSYRSTPFSKKLSNSLTVSARGICIMFLSTSSELDINVKVILKWSDKSFEILNFLDFVFIKTSNYGQTHLTLEASIKKFKKDWHSARVVSCNESFWYSISYFVERLRFLLRNKRIFHEIHHVILIHIYFY